VKILAIETSCDETSLSIIEAKGGLKNPSFKVISHALSSQADLHAQYGGVFPAMAKREHARALPFLLKEILRASSKVKSQKSKVVFKEKTVEKIKGQLERERDLFEPLMQVLQKYQKPKIDLIVVTKGPGLEPALWVGINFAKALAKLWDIKIIGADHMRGHAVSVLLQEKKTKIDFPAMALLVSGGHTEIVLVKDFNTYKKIGTTRDDAAGEAFDKVARMLSLPYPGGPEISKLASKFKLEIKNEGLKIKLPRPMMHTNDFDFSFSGLKTAVLYTIRDLEKVAPMTDSTKAEIAHEFEEAVVEVLDKKLFKAIAKYKAKSIIVGGGVSANITLKEKLTESAKKINLPIIFPQKNLSTDNSIMIGMTGYFKFMKKGKADSPKSIIADGGLEI